MGTTPGYVEKLAGAYSLPSLDFFAEMKRVHPELSVELVIAAKKEREKIRRRA